MEKQFKKAISVCNMRDKERSNCFNQYSIYQVKNELKHFICLDVKILKIN